MSRFVDGILVGIGIGLIVLAGGMYCLIAVVAAEAKGQENATTSQTGSQWVIVRKYSDTTVTDTVTVPSVGQHVTYSASADNFVSWYLSVFEVVGFIGAVFILIGIIPPKKKTPAPSTD